METVWFAYGNGMAKGWQTRWLTQRAVGFVNLSADRRGFRPRADNGSVFDGGLDTTLQVSGGGDAQ